MSAESPERANRLPRCQSGPEAIPKSGQDLDADVVTYEAVTPALVSVEPMIVLDASGNEVEPQVPGARTPEQRGEEDEAEPQPSVMNVEELAALLRVNRKTVYEALSRGEIPGARRLGASYRILRGAVLEWLASGQDRVARSRRNR
jgi:excisionase family DNA binding protein